MASFSIDIADADVARVTRALSAAAGFPDDPTEAHAMAAVTAWIQQVVFNVESSVANQAALDAVVAPAPVVIT
jgi:hypothetical protein